jgi:cathepsin L
MKTAVFIIACIACAYAAPPLDLEALLAKPEYNWETFKTKYERMYEDLREELHRYKTYASNVLRIEAHNLAEALTGVHGYTLAINEFADMSNDEFRQLRNTYVMRSGPSNGSRFLAPEGLELPPSVDWRPKGYVTKVKNQGQCGSCWAFSTTGSLEGQHFKKTGKLVSLSEQNLVDCAGGKYGNQGCQGGLMDQAFSYIRDNKGIDTEASYPYKGRNDNCHFNRANVGATDTGYVDVKSGDEKALEQATATVGPISVAIDASHFSFQFYSHGVYNPWWCSSTRLDHGVLVVGYGTDDKGKQYWIVKNSWGPGWGNEGYIWMARNANNKCGIATQASYPLV